MIAWLLDLSMRALVVAGTVGLILRIARVESSSVRHAAWTAVLASMLLMPVLPDLVPAIPIPVQSPRFDALPLISQADADGVRDHQRTVNAVPVSPSPRAIVPSGAAPARWRLWPAFAIGIYAAVLLLLLLRTALGWRAMTRVTRGAIPIAGAPFFESPIVVSPVTAGVFFPRIVLPAAWRAWSDDKRHAVLAHELAHVRRRDPLVAFVAHVNRCVFWFHPLAWWLERTIAATAEQACDDAAVRDMGEARRYAEVLLDIAGAVRRSGGRIAWQGLGVDGNGLLSQRIDRILRGDVLRHVSRGRKIVVAVSCAAAIVLVVGCRQRASAPPLREDPDTARLVQERKANDALYKSVETMTVEQVDQLQAAFQANPGDFETLKKLRAFYGVKAQKLFGWDQMIVRRRPIITRLIETHPEHELSVWTISAAADPIGYAEAKKRWLAQTSKPDASAAVLNNAARFFENEEPREAEQLLLRAKALDAGGKIVTPNRLGAFYASVIRGPRDPRDGHPTRPLEEDAYAQDVITRLTASNDAAMLTAAGTDLVTRAYQDPTRAQLGRQYLQRALRLDPAQKNARRMIFAADEMESKRKLQATLRLKQASLAGADIERKVRMGERLTEADIEKMRTVQYEAASWLPVGARFPALADLADNAYMWAEHLAYTVKDDAGARVSRDRSKRAAQDALALAPSQQQNPMYSATVYRATIALAAHALLEGDRKTAVRDMLDAVKVPPSEQLALGTEAGLSDRVVNGLLAAGERESVATFLEKSAALRTSDAPRLKRDAASIRAGRMPLSYQFQNARTEDQ